MKSTKKIYSSPWWLRGRHAQTIWGKIVRKREKLPLTRRILATPDEDEVELYSLPEIAGRAHVILFHGLEGSLRSHYVNGILSAVARANLNGHVMMFRSCGSEANRTRRFYHSGDTSDAALVTRLLTSEHPHSHFFLVGVSLGGNVLLKYLGESAEQVPPTVRAAAAVSVPYDLSLSAKAINSGFSRMYQQFFLGTLKAKLAEKARKFPDLPAATVIENLKTMVAFDDAVTAPLHGFSNAEDYYRRSSALGFLNGIRVPTLLLSAYDDPFLPGEVLKSVEREAKRNPALHIEFHAHGGHVGFVSGRFPWQAEYYIDNRILEFFESRTRPA